VGCAPGPEHAIVEGLVNTPTLESETTYMHDAVMALMFMVIVMFPCFLSSATPE